MKNEKVLILASVASMIDQFNMSNIHILLSMNYEVHVACNFEKGNTCNQEKIDKLKNRLNELNVKYYQIDFTRSVFKIFEDIKAYKQVKKILNENNYKFVHCHSPIGGAIGRLVCRSTNAKCMYTAHGFHFFKGAPLKNWIIFYPIEKYLSKYTDVLITINKEDYKRAKNKFKMKQLEYIPGVGVDTKKFQSLDFDRNSYRNKLGYRDSDFVILSVGEINCNKNHEIILRSIAELKDDRIKYLIAGQGELKDYLLDLSKKLNIDKQFKLLGFRNDIVELNYSADIFAFPSKREGLGLAAIEAMATGLPIITSNVHGINDYSINRKTGFSYSPEDYIGFSKGIKFLFEHATERQKIKDINMNIAKKYDISNVNSIMLKIYESM